MRRLLLLCPLLFGCSDPTPTAGVAPVAPRPAPPPPAVVPVEGRFGEKVKVGDLEIVAEAYRNLGPSGQYRGEFQQLRCGAVCLKVTNTHPGRIADWPGWHTASITDEHGNVFKPLDLYGWTWLPGNMPNPDGGPDRGARIDPGKTRVRYLYTDEIPKTSKTLSVSGVYAGIPVRLYGEPR